MVFFRFLILLAVLGGSLLGRENELWLALNQRAPLGIDLRAELRYREDGSEIYFAYVQGLVHFPVNSWLEVAPGYRQGWRIIEGEWRNIYVPIAEATASWDRRVVRVEDRNRMQFVAISDLQSRWVYRNRLRISLPWAWLHIGFTPYVYDEFFLVEGVGLAENRLAAGIFFELLCISRIECEFMLRDFETREGWRRSQVFKFEWRRGF